MFSVFSFKIFWRHIYINLGSFNISMSQKIAERKRVTSVNNKVSRKSMTELMWIHTKSRAKYFLCLTTK